jgi:hypothetical protein
MGNTPDKPIIISDSDESDSLNKRFKRLKTATHRPSKNNQKDFDESDSLDRRFKRLTNVTYEDLKTNKKGSNISNQTKRIVIDLVSSESETDSSDNYVTNSDSLKSETSWTDSLDEIINDPKTNKNPKNQKSPKPEAKISKKQVRELVWKKYCPKHDDKGKCFCCGDKIRKSKTHVEYGHIVPSCVGGSYTMDNIRPVCINCNRGKGGMHTMNMYEFIIRNNMYGMKHLKPQERKLYVHNVDVWEDIICQCCDILDSLTEKRIISSSKEIRLRKIIVATTDPKDIEFQATVDKIMSLKKRHNIT